MKLSSTWFTEAFIDFELQQYRLQAWLQEVKQSFDRSELYPQLSELVFHYNNVISFRNNKRVLQEQFPAAISKVDIQKLQLIYERMAADDELMRELEAITDYATLQMKPAIDNGTELYETIATRLTIAPVGILPLYKREGYLLIQQGRQRSVCGYAYIIEMLEQGTEKYRSIRLQYINEWNSSLANTHYTIKKEIIRRYPALPSPAVYAIVTDMELPFEQTLLPPVAKRSFMRFMALDAAA